MKLFAWAAIGLAAAGLAPVAAQPSAPERPALPGPQGNLTPQRFAEIKAKADSGDLDAQATIAAWLVVGSPGVPADPAAAARLLRRGAERGHMMSVTFLAAFLMGGPLGFEKNEAESLRLYTLCADKAEDKGLRGLCSGHLGTAHLAGWGTARDPAAAVRWFRKGAELGHVESMGWLGVAYAGRVGGLEQDFAEAVRWLRPAADKGQKEAAAMLGTLYINGQGVPKDRARGVELLDLAARNRSGTAAMMLGVGHLRGVNGFEKDAAKAFHYAKLAAASGLPDGAAFLGLLHGQGQGTPANHEEAARWSRIGAERGSADAMVEMTFIYARSEGRLVGKEEAMRWLRVAADKKHKRAMYLLAGILERGLGQPANREEALRWYRAAAAAGHEESRQALVRLGAEP